MAQSFRLSELVGQDRQKERPKVPLDGGTATEYSITVNDPQINQGQWTNIPSIYGGKVVSQDEAIKRVVEAKGVDPETGRKLTPFATLEMAEKAAQERSDMLGKTRIDQKPMKLSDLIGKGGKMPKETPKEGFSFGDLFTGSERKEGIFTIDGKEMTTGELPEFDMPFEFSKRQAKTALGLLTTMSPQGQLNVIKEHYPKIKFIEDNKGSIIIDAREEGGKIGVMNMPGVSMRDIMQVGFQVASYMPAVGAAGMAARGAGAVGAGAGVQLAARAGIGAAAAAETAIGLGEVSEEMGGEAATPGEVGLAGAFGAAGELIMPVVNYAKTAKAARDSLKESRQVGGPSLTAQEFARGEKTAEKAGMVLYPAQKSLDPYALHKQAFLGELPTTARKARNALLRQNESVATSVDDFLVRIAPLTATADENIRSIAGDIIKNAKLARTNQTSPAFQKAYDIKKAIDVDHVIANLDKELDKYGAGEIRRLLKKTKAIVKSAAKPVNGKNIERLHNAKRSIWSEIERYETKSGKALTPEIKAKLTDTYGNVVRTLRNEVPEYARALDEFISLTPDITQLQKGKIGQLAKLKDSQLDNVTKVIFDAGETDPALLLQTKKYIEAESPNAWNIILRQEAQKRLKNIDLETTELIPGNLPAKIQSALFGTGNKRSIFMDSLSQEQRLNAFFIEDGLTRAAKGRPGGSPTGIRNIITQELNGVFKTVMTWFRDPFHRLAQTGDDASFNTAANKLAKIMFDPDWTPFLTKVRKMKDIKDQYKAMLQLMNDVDNSESEVPR